jgi:hypothetical protein
MEVNNKKEKEIKKKDKKKIYHFKYYIPVATNYKNN